MNECIKEEPVKEKLEIFESIISSHNEMLEVQSKIVDSMGKSMSLLTVKGDNAIVSHCHFSSNTKENAIAVGVEGAEK